MTRGTELPLRLLSFLLELGKRDTALVASMKREFGIADLADNTERWVSAALADALLAWLHRQTGERDLGFRLGLEGPISAAGTLGVYLAACPNLLAALGAAQAWYPLLSWDGSGCRLAPHARGIVLEITELEIRSIADVLRQDVVLGRLLTLARRIGGERLRPLLIVYPESGFGMPDGIEAHATQVTRAPGRLALLFGEDEARRPAEYPNAWLMQALEPVLEKELAQLTRADSLGGQIRAWLVGMESLADVSQARAAERFHLSESSLKRRLAEEETSFSDLLQSHRRDRALELLTTTDDKLESIALALGFSERASFERAFRGWFDATPSSYREQIRRLTGGEAGIEAIDVDKLPSSPRVCAQILELLNRENYHLDELVRLVNLDPALTARIMAIARSAFYGGRSIRTLGEAIVKVLGVNQVRYLALISAANSEFRRDLAAGFDLARYWLEALLRTNLVTAALERGAPRVGSSGYELCLAALLLDIGSFMLAHVRPARMADYLARSRSLSSEDERHALQREIFGSSLRAAGALLMAHWNLPREAIRIVRELDAPEPADGASCEAHLVHSVSRYVQDAAQHADDADRQEAFISAVTGSTGMTAEAARRLVDHHQRQVADMEALVAQLLR